MWKKAGTWDSRSYSTYAFTPPFFLRNFAHQKTDKHKGIVVESKAYTLPCNLKISVTRFFLACSIIKRYDSHDSDWQKQMSFSQ